MKVLHLSSAKSWRGGEQQIAWLFLELKNLGLQQWIACPKNSALEEWCLRNEAPVFGYTKQFSADPNAALQIKRFCKKEKIKLLHIHDSHAHNFAVMASALWGNKVSMVLSRRVDFPISKSWFSRWKYNYPQIKHIICVSHFISKLLSPDIKNSERLVTVHDGVDLKRFGFIREGRLHRELDLDPGVKLIGNVAAIAPHKDYFTFVDTAAILLKENLALHFLIIGADGGEEAAIREYIGQKNLEDKITLLGFRSDIPELLPELDVFLFTSKTEGLGSSILDAFTCRVAVVATRAGGIPEIVNDGHNGLLAPVQDSTQLARQVLRLFQEADLNVQLVKNAFDWVQQYSCSAMAEQTLAIYRKSVER